ncbi:uncharacterized protein FIESC28_06955 [Fusarium coffeatum]|uniref:F-box domain-containing protein n=1 Tax=Fusarium coffeatum TaxID=231269 RepID=A0A366RJG3_9HYPO|nr:uncharacterized protein FIESC28_06955 [Fusarium coffeatum]RBR16546.1 hypothetical protein FIESC28_06955 [Fusarium coffeatum]
MADDCVICGGGFAYHNPDSNPSWAAVLRIARCRPGDSKVTITGRGYKDEYGFFVPTDPDCSVPNESSEAELERHRRVSVTRELSETQILVFHEFCWSMLLDHMSLSVTIGYEKNSIAQALYDLMLDLPRGEPWGAYFGDFCFGKQPTEDDYLKADPNKEFTFTIHGRSTLPYPTDQIPVSTQSRPDRFSQLPIEITYHMVSFLDLPSLCNFRLSSKFIASLCSQYRLPQEFWESRFAAEHEMGFLPLVSSSLPAAPDWRQLYFDLKEDLRSPSQIRHLRRRRRIWNCVRDLRQLLTMLLQQDQNIRDVHSVREDPSLHELVATRKAQALLQIPSTRKSLQYVNLDPQYWGADMIRLSISTITNNSTEYICGFRVRIEDGTDIGEVVSLAGHIAPATETHISFKPSDDLLHVRVTVSSGGLLGLEFQTRHMQDHMIWKSTGQLRGLPFYSDIISLDARANSRVTGILVGFDLFKATSVQLVEDIRHRASSSRLG